MTTLLEDFAALRARITWAESERDTWRTSGSQEKYLDACSLVAALDLRLERLRDQGLRRSAQSEKEAASPLEAFSIAYDGRHYHYEGYRYDHLEDAVAYAKLQRSRSGYRPQPPAAPRPTVEPPNAPQLETMAALGITFRDGVYRWGPYRYDRLAHAVSYARLQLALGPPI